HRTDHDTIGSGCPRETASVRINQAERKQTVVANAKDCFVSVAVYGIYQNSTGTTQHHDRVIEALSVLNNHSSGFRHLSRVRAFPKCHDWNLKVYLSGADE